MCAVIRIHMRSTTSSNGYASLTRRCGWLRHRKICDVYMNMWSNTLSTDMRCLLEDVTDYTIDYVIEGFMHCLLEYVSLADKRRYKVTYVKFYFWNVDTSINKPLCFGLKFLAILNHSKFENEQRKLLNGGDVTEVNFIFECRISWNIISNPILPPFVAS